MRIQVNYSLCIHVMQWRHSFHTARIPIPSQHLPFNIESESANVLYTLEKTHCINVTNDQRRANIGDKLNKDTRTKKKNACKKRRICETQCISNFNDTTFKPPNEKESGLMDIDRCT